MGPDLLNTKSFSDHLWRFILIFANKGITLLFSGILFICAREVSFAARARSARAANDTTRAQINNIPEKRHAIIIIFNKQGIIVV